MMRLSDMLFKTPSSKELTGEFNTVYTTKVVLIKQEQIFSITTFFGTDLTYQRLVFKKISAIKDILSLTKFEKCS